MPLELPDNAEEITSAAKTDVQNALTTSDPFTKNHWLGAIISGVCNRIFDFYLQLKLAINLNFPDTATDIYLDRWKAIYGISTITATQASGFLVATGTLGASIPINTTFTNRQGATYTATSPSSIILNALPVNTLTRTGQVATLSFLIPHNLADGVTLTVSGAAQTNYNGNRIVTVVDELTVTYVLTGTPVTPATGAILASAKTALVAVQASVAGSNGNQSAGSIVSLQSPVVGVNTDLVVPFSAIGGGNDQETPDSSRSRLLTRIRQPTAHFNAAEITNLAFTIAGITRVFVQTPNTATTTIYATLTTKSGPIAIFTFPAAVPFYDGQLITIAGVPEAAYNLTDVNFIKASGNRLCYTVGDAAPLPTGDLAIVTGSDVSPGVTRVYFMRDNDNVIIPDPSEVTTLKNLLLTIMPANMASSDLVVAAPTPNVVNFHFSVITPSTPEMQEALRSTLFQMMIDRTSVGLGIAEQVYNSYIISAYEEISGLTPSAFAVTISDDLGSVTDINGSLGYIPVLGEVTF